MPMAPGEALPRLSAGGTRIHPLEVGRGDALPEVRVGVCLFCAESPLVIESRGGWPVRGGTPSRMDLSSVASAVCRR
jgi:hypothetical protein